MDFERSLTFFPPSLWNVEIRPLSTRFPFLAIYTFWSFWYLRKTYQNLKKYSHELLKDLSLLVINSKVIDECWCLNNRAFLPTSFSFCCRFPPARLKWGRGTPWSRVAGHDKKIPKGKRQESPIPCLRRRPTFRFYHVKVLRVNIFICKSWKVLRYSNFT